MEKIKSKFIQNFKILTSMPTTWDFFENKKRKKNLKGKKCTQNRVLKHNSKTKFYGIVLMRFYEKGYFNNTFY